MFTPFLRASETFKIISFNDFLIPLIPSLILYKTSIEVVLKSLCSMYFILSKSSLDMTGFLINIFLHCSGQISKILTSLPMVKLVSVIISSLIPSKGGFVT